jgi:hypothetical protein
MYNDVNMREEFASTMSKEEKKRENVNQRVFHRNIREHMKVLRKVEDYNYSRHYTRHFHYDTRFFFSLISRVLFYLHLMNVPVVVVATCW